MIWKPVDWLGYKLAKWWTPQLQVRTGTVLTILGVLLLVYTPLSGEPPLIYFMSALALIIGGLSVLVTAVLAVAEDPDMTSDDLDPRSGDDD